LDNSTNTVSKVDDIKKIKKELLLMSHEKLQRLNVEYVNELKDLAKTIFTIFN
jgi:hypothetical protein